MGWLRRDRNGPAGFYTGDAPVSAPGLGNSEPTAYGTSSYTATPFGTDPGDIQGDPSGGGAGQGPVGQASAGQASATNDPAPGWNAAPWTPAPGPGAVPVVPRRSGPWGKLLLFFVVLSLIAGGIFYLMVGRSGSDSADQRPAVPGTPTAKPTPGRTTAGEPDPTTGPTSTGASTPVAPPLTPMDKATAVTVGSNTYTVTVRSAQWQQAAAWNQTSKSSKNGHLVIDLVIKRTDKESYAAQISWFDWVFDPSNGKAAEAELVGGGYGNELKTLNLKPGEKATGTITFAMKATKGTLQLRSADTVVGRWSVTAAQHPTAAGALGKTVSTPVGQLPFSVKVSSPVWTASGSASLGNDPKNGYFLVLDAVYTSTRKADPDAGRPDYVDPTNWRFTPKKGRAHLGVWGQVGRDLVDQVQVWPGEKASGKVLLDVPGVAGTLSLIGRDDVPVISWSIPGP